MDESCPHCGVKFPADHAWANRTIKGLLVSPVFLDTEIRVRCPSCNFVFPATEYRYFGFISPRLMKTGLLLIAAVAIFWILFSLFDEPTE
jgi:hypothetical protein